jgi:hypothetical protein
VVIRNTAPAGKIVLLVVLLLVSLTVLGCVGLRSSPEGGSGGTIADSTLFLSPTIKPAGGFGCSSPNVNGKLVALNATDGTRIWEFTMEGSTSGGGFGCQSSATPARFMLLISLQGR